MKNEIVNASVSASVVVSVNVNAVNVNGHAYEYGENEYGENEYDQRRSVGAGVFHVFQFARLSAHQLLRGLEGQHLPRGHTLAMTELGEVVYAHGAADMCAVAMVVGTPGVEASPSTLRSALFQWA